MVIGHKWYVTNFALNCGTPNDIYLERGTYLGEVTPIFKKLRNKGVKIVSYDEEGGLNYRKFDEYANRYNFASYIDTFDAWLTWGPRDYSFFKLNIAVSNCSTSICDFGTPRSGLWNAERISMRQRLTKGDDSSPFILLATNFVYSNSIMQSPERAFANVDKDIRSKILHDLQFGKKRNLDELNYQRFREVIDLVLRHTPLDIMVRPHPVEKDAHLSNELVEEFSSPRVQIDKSNSLTSQLKKAKLLVHSGSTSSIESALYELPAISLENFLIEDEFILQTFSDVFSYSPRDRKELLEIIQKWEVKSSPGNNSAITDIIWFDNSFEFYKKFVKLLEQLISSTNQRALIEMVRMKPNYFRIILELLNARLKSERNLLDRTKRPRITSRELKTELNYVTSLLGIQNDFYIRKLDRSTYQIEPRD